MPKLSVTVETRKFILLWLLAGSCLTAFLVLMFYPEIHRKPFQSLAEADSLIQQELALFNIPREQIRIFEYPVTEHFTRKRYVVDLPVPISKTHLHAELNRQLRNRHVKTIGFVDVPANEMTLHIIYRDKIIRSLDLRTDRDLVRIPHPATLKVYFDRSPTSSQTERLRQIGIPVSIVLRSGSRRTLLRWASDLPEELLPAGIWIDDTVPDDDDTSRDDPEWFRTLEALSEMQQAARLLVVTSGDAGRNIAGRRILEELEAEIIPADDLMVIATGDRREFDRQMLAYSRLARQAGVPRALVKVSDETLDWLEDWIPRIQRGGVVFTVAP